jgi:hypothetical protein
MSSAAWIFKSPRQSVRAPADEIAAGRSIILCTDMQKDIASITFASRQIKLLGKLLASADLLAQLSEKKIHPPEQHLFLTRNSVCNHHIRKSQALAYKICQRMALNHELCPNRTLSSLERSNSPDIFKFKRLTKSLSFLRDVI